MNKFFPAEITDGIYWTGVRDWDIRAFDIVMHTEYGTTYNSYAVKGAEKTALIECAKLKFFDEYLERLTAVTDPAKADYLIVNHTEPDHSGGIERLLELNPDIEIVGSAVALRYLKNILNRDFKGKPVKDGDEIDLGGKTLRFITASFLHWPDSIYTWCPEDKTLFTCDSFGCHYCSEELFADSCGDFSKAYKYYFDVIMGPFKAYVLAALDKIAPLPIEFVCPGHGPILREDLEKYFNLYRQWSMSVKPERPAIAIAYVSAYGFTEALAAAIEEGVRETGLTDVTALDITADSALAAKLAGEADGLLIGSPTLVGDILPPVWELLGKLNPIVHRGKTAGFFGSYGWSGEAAAVAESRFKQLKFNVPLPALRTVLKPSAEDLAAARQFGRDFAAQVEKSFSEKYK